MYIRDFPIEIIVVITVTHLNQSLKFTADGGIGHGKGIAIGPADVIQAVCVGLVHSAVPDITLQLLITGAVHQSLASGDFYQVTGSSRLSARVVGIHNGTFLGFHMHQFG